MILYCRYKIVSSLVVVLVCGLWPTRSSSCPLSHTLISHTLVAPQSHTHSSVSHSSESHTTLRIRATKNHSHRTLCFDIFAAQTESTGAKSNSMTFLRSHGTLQPQQRLLRAFPTHCDSREGGARFKILLRFSRLTLQFVIYLSIWCLVFFFVCVGWVVETTRDTYS